MLVNVGRGGHLNEVDLLKALDSGQVNAAVLDVLENEPPGSDHVFWNHPRVWLTPHVAASTRVESGCKVLLDNMRLDLAGMPMQGEVSRQAGY
jgi:glyoxylate/hydroxypyruvate reductase A